MHLLPARQQHGGGLLAEVRDHGDASVPTVGGRLTPSFIVAHEIPPAAAPDAYDKLDRRVDGDT